MSQNHHQSRLIIISGAGPSGLTAAICLARAGYLVQIHEAREAVGARFIDDFQVIENTSLTEDVRMMLRRIGLKTNFYFEPAHHATFYHHRLHAQQVQSRQPYGYFIRRGPEAGTLDQGLLAQALEAGVSITYRSRIRPEKATIVATGPAVPDGLAKEMTFKTDLPDTISVLFDFDVAPGGYSYLFVIEGQATFGCAVTLNFDYLNDYFDQSLRRFQSISQFSIKAARYGYSFMNFFLKKSALLGGRPYVGEAGGFQDYLFGLGIRYALMTGFAAAESIIKNTDYDRLCRKEIGGAQEVSLVNRALYEIGGNLGLSTFVSRAGKGDLQVYLQKWHRPAAWKGLLSPLLKRIWREKGDCFHKVPVHWCRKKIVSSTKISLGETRLRKIKTEEKGDVVANK